MAAWCNADWMQIIPAITLGRMLNKNDRTGRKAPGSIDVRIRFDSDEFENRLSAIVTETEAGLEDAGVTTGTFLVGRSDLLDEVLHR